MDGSWGHLYLRHETRLDEYKSTRDTPNLCPQISFVRAFSPLDETWSDQWLTSSALNKCLHLEQECSPSTAQLERKVSNIKPFVGLIHVL